MTVKELMQALAKADPNLEVVVRTMNEGGDSFCGPIRTAEPEMGHDDEPFFAIDCDDIGE